MFTANDQGQYVLCTAPISAERLCDRLNATYKAALVSWENDRAARLDQAKISIADTLDALAQKRETQTCYEIPADLFQDVKAWAESEGILVSHCGDVGKTIEVTLSWSPRV